MWKPLFCARNMGEGRDNSQPPSFLPLIWPTLNRKIYLIIPQCPRLQSGSQILDCNCRFCDDYTCVFASFADMLFSFETDIAQPGNFWYDQWGYILRPTVGQIGSKKYLKKRERGMCSPPLPRYLTSHSSPASSMYLWVWTMPVQKDQPSADPLMKAHLLSWDTFAPHRLIFNCKRPVIEGHLLNVESGQANHKMCEELTMHCSMNGWGRTRSNAWARICFSTPESVHR